MTDLYSYEPITAKHAAKWAIDCDGRRQKADRIKPGLYRVHWIIGGHSLAAIGCGFNGDNWIAPINWQNPSTIPALEGGTWGLVKSIDLIEAETDEPNTIQGET